jgi:hypothetical protein
MLRWETFHVTMTETAKDFYWLAKEIIHSVTAGSRHCVNDIRSSLMLNSTDC